MGAHPEVTFSGKTYEVKPLPIRHIRTVLPLGNDLSKRIDGAAVTAETIDAFYTVGFTLMKIVDPAITKEAFEELHITPAEIARALPVFIAQAGLERKEAPPAGEAAAESGATTSSTTS